MSDSGGRRLFVRHPSNPILTAEDVPYPANTVFNPGAARVDDETVLLLRVEDLRGISSLLVARSTDGVSDWRLDDKPLLAPDPAHPEEVWGCEDPRLVFLPEREEWAITYTAYSRRGPLVSLAMTVTSGGPSAWSGDAAGRQGRGPLPAPVRRPLDHDPPPGAAPGTGAHVDLVLAGPAALGRPRRAARGARRGMVGRRQDRARAAAARDRAGWLVMYHGAHTTASGPIYRVGLALLDLEHPELVLRRSDEWVMAPRPPTRPSATSTRSSSRTAGCSTRRPIVCRSTTVPGDSVVGLAEARFSELMEYMAQAPLHQHRRSEDDGRG